MFDDNIIAMKDFLRRVLVTVIIFISLSLMIRAAHDVRLSLYPMGLSVILILLTYLWAKELMGRWWALLPTFLLGFSPTFLAYSHKVSGDINFSLALVISMLAFLGLLSSRSKLIILLSGLSLGMALFISWQAFILIPYFILLLIGHYFVGREHHWLKFILAVLIAIGFNLTAAFIIYQSIGNYFNAALLNLQILINASKVSWPGDFFFKEPLPSLIMIVFAFIISLGKFLKSFWLIFFRRSRIWLDYLNTHFLEFSMTLFIIFWLRKIMISEDGDAVRHFLPLLPFLYILTAGVIKRWFSLDEIKKIRNFLVRLFVMSEELVAISIKSLLLAVFLIWYFITALMAAPDFDKYVNVLERLFN